jgi:YidC/Oxa1 family membrane protein insertase
MAKMRVVTPKLMKLKERYGDDKQKLNQEMMEALQAEKINPLGGCLPIAGADPGLHRALLGAAGCRRNA